jgi:LemA protein
MGLIPFLIVAFAVVGVLIYLATIYNGLVALRNDMDKAWANIDVLLKQRHDELPRLVDVCKGYMQYERETLQTLTDASPGSAV